MCVERRPDVAPQSSPPDLHTMVCEQMLLKDLDRSSPVIAASMNFCFGRSSDFETDHYKNDSSNVTVQ